MVKISVIMPVFNDELYLEEAIESVVNQTLKDIELVCIDDGSTDSSLDILNRLSDKYGIIRIISQENQGVAAARNNAMDAAVGEYLAFLDSDDIFIEVDALERLYQVAHENDANMVSGNLIIWDGDKDFVPIKFMKYYDKEEIILPEDYGIPFSFTKAIFKRKFLTDNKIRFPLLTKGEDPVFLAEILSKLDCLYAVPVDVYAYRYIDGSVKYNSYKNYHDQVSHYKMVFDYMSDSKFDRITHKFRYQLIGLIDFMGDKQAKPTLKAIRDVFADDPKTLRQCEEYFYYKYQDNEELSKLVELKKDPQKPRISVIVPIYNNERHLKSIKYILDQSLDDLEILCINDGSRDDSSDALKEFVDDERVRIINQEHGGYADVKNRGLKEARGEYVYFHEPGTFLSQKYFEIIYKNAIVNDSDIILSRFFSSDSLHLDIHNYKFDLSKENDVNFHKHVFDYKEFSSCVLNYPFSLTYKLYKKEFLDENDDLTFNSDIAFDDVIFHVKSMLRASKISFAKNIRIRYKFDLNNNYFNYSISKHLLDIVNKVETVLKENNCYNDLFDEFKLFKFTSIVNNMAFVNDEDYFSLSKAELSKLNFTKFDDVNQDLLERYLNVVKSNTLKEFKLYEDKRRNAKINSKYKSLLNNKKKLNKENKKLKKEINKSKKLNKEILSSKSWKVTNPLRNLKNSSKK